MKKSLIIGLCIMLIIIAGASATNYYYNATTGDDANDCSTSALACQSIADLNGKVLTAGDNVYFKCGDVWRINPFYDDRIIANESGSSITGDVTWTRYGDCDGTNDPLFLGSYPANTTNQWVETGDVNLTGTLGSTFYINTPYYNLTMQEGTITYLYSTSENFQWARGVASVNFTTGAMLNGSLYLMGGNVAATSCTARNVSTSYGLGIEANCSNTNAENVWTFYNSFITVNSTSKNGHRYLWQHAAPYNDYTIYMSVYNGTSNKTGSAGQTDWDSQIGVGGFNFIGGSLTNYTYVFDWDESKTTDVDYCTNGTLSTQGMRIARGSELTEGKYLFQIIKLLPINQSASYPDKVTDVSDLFKDNRFYNDTITTGTNIWQWILNTNETYHVGNIVSNDIQIGNFSLNYNSIDSQHDFYENISTGVVYMYSESNPATYYGNLELSLGSVTYDEMMYVSGNWQTIRNLDFRNGGNALINSYYNKGTHIINNTFMNGGGIWEVGGYGVRYGGNIGFECRNQLNEVAYNYFYGGWDQGVGAEAPTWCSNWTIEDFSIHHNTLDSNGVGFGVISSHDTLGSIRRINFTQNTIIKSGWGWTEQRPNKGIAILFASSPNDVQDYNFTNNIITTPDHEWINLGWDVTTRWNSTTFPYFNYNLYYGGNHTQKIYWNGSTYNNLSSFQTGKGQEANGAETNPLFISIDPLSADYLVPYADSPACSMSSTGGYVGAVPCSTTDYSDVEVKIINTSSIIIGDSLNIFFNSTALGNCSLYVNNTIQSYNASTLPNTKTNLSTGSLIDGNKTIYVNCTTTTQTNKSNIIWNLLNIAPISGMTQVDSTDDSISLEWTDPTTNFNHTEVWILNGTWTLTGNSTGGNYTIEGLEPSTSYEVMGISVGDGGTRGSNSSTGVSTAATTNDTTTYYIRHTFLNLNMSDGCNGNISLASNSTLWAAVCINDMTSDVYCTNYTGGSIGVGNSTYFNYTLTYGQEYRIHYIWNMIQYISMNDTDLNGKYDVGTTIPATLRTSCTPAATGGYFVDGYGDRWYNYYGSSSTNCYYETNEIGDDWKLYWGTTDCAWSRVMNHQDNTKTMKGLPDDYRIYVGQSTQPGASDATGTCARVGKRYSSYSCYTISTPYYVMQDCTDGIEEYARYPLCDYAGSYDSYTDSFTYYGSGQTNNVSANPGEEIGSLAILNVEQDGNPPSEIIITSPTEGENTTRYINITYSVVGTDFEYYNLSVLNSDVSFNSTIIGNNSINTSHYWDSYYNNLSIGEYNIKVAAILVNGSEAASNFVTVNILRNMWFNVTATNNNTGIPITDFIINITNADTGEIQSESSVDNETSFDLIKEQEYYLQYISSEYNETITFTTNTSTYQSMNLNIIIPTVAVSTACSQSTAMTFKLYDEDTLQLISGDFNYNFNITIANTTVLLYGNYSNSSNISLCVNASVGQTWTVNKGEIQYESTGYVNRRYYVFGGTRISGTTTNISMYDLNSSFATAFQITANARDLTLYDNKYVTLVRWYPELNQYNVVDMGLTDDVAQTVLYARTQDTDYRMGIYELDGTLIYLANPIRMVCLATPCSYDLISTASTSTYSTFEKLQYSWNVNKTSGIWLFTYNDPSQVSQTISLNIYKDSGTNEIRICQNNLTAYTGAISCNSSGWTGSLRGVVVRTASPGVPIAQYLANVGESAFKSSLGLFLVIILALPVVFLLAVISPIAALIGGVLALVPGVYLGSIDFTVVGAAAIMAVIIIHFMKRP